MVRKKPHAGSMEKKIQKRGRTCPRSGDRTMTSWRPTLNKSFVDEFWFLHPISENNLFPLPLSPMGQVDDVDDDVMRGWRSIDSPSIVSRLE